jgi:hypothetical protein
MTYKILSTRQADAILYTEVEYTLGETTTVVEVAHFNPKSKEEVETSIINRADSELKNIQIAKQVKQLLTSIELNQVKDITI